MYQLLMNLNAVQSSRVKTEVRTSPSKFLNFRRCWPTLKTRGYRSVAGRLDSSQMKRALLLAASIALLGCAGGGGVTPKLKPAPDPGPLSVFPQGGVLHPPRYAENDPRWHGQGDPQPYIRSSGRAPQIIATLDGTPYAVSLNGVQVASDGKRTATSIKTTSVPANPYLSITVPPTVARTYRDGTTPLIKDKVQLSFRDGDFDLTNGMTRHVSFEFMLDKSYQASANAALILFQVWQGLGCHAPFFIANVITENATDPVTLKFVCTDDAGDKIDWDEIAKHQWQTGSKIIDLLQVTRGEWHKLSFELRAHYNGATTPEGKIVIQYDNDTPVTYTGDWGCKPVASSPYHGGSIVKEGQTGMGIYRVVQSRTQTVSFRSITAR
jgi:hypothetical protein